MFGSTVQFIGAIGLIPGCVEFSVVPLRLKLMSLTFEASSASSKIALTLFFS